MRALNIAVVALTLAIAMPAVAAPKLRAWVTTGDKTQLLTAQAPSSLATADQIAGLPTLVVDPKERRQSMVGFGGAITDASAWLIQTRLSPDQRDKLLRELYGRGEGQLGFSFTRITIGASDFSLDHYSLDDGPGGAADPKLEHFSLARPQQYVFPTVRAALRINPALKVMASPWSAPAWMKTSGSLIQGQLKPAAYPVYADFFARYVKGARKLGVPTDYLSIQNEPDFEPDSYPGMRWPAPDRARFFGENLAPTFKREKIATRVLDWDHNWDQPQQPLTVLADPKAKAFLAGVAWHCYAGEVSAQDQVRAAHPDEDAFLTECSGGQWAPKFDDSFAWMVENLIIGSTRAGARGVLMWNLALDETFGPHKGGCNDCRAFVTIDSRTGAITRTQEYYAFGHASRFVKPGATRIGSPAKLGDLRTVAFQNRDGGRVLIVLNLGPQPATFAISEGANRFRATAPGRAAVTFVW
ncbi:glycoside hydrolase family 30 beta sandwich domain-containing protein [Caulobacter sp. BK020]|uniref:glycoside hydrolase family 30 protein n=1 Tax=Caulobacter sp. BK020 TaxID=2512117 RepID=UPI00104B78A0|nr:glycoside hydrolase family 30 beta sandwich domain-containing protein [Caulobacter sp. BK020]TCS14992.1 glucosylceramidase [Caulobacter sp. BK020]